jgi:hypothetical protein
MGEREGEREGIMRLMGVIGQMGGRREEARIRRL